MVNKLNGSRPIPRDRFRLAGTWVQRLHGLATAAAFVAFLPGGVLVFGQSLSISSPQSARAAKIFAVRCASCHGTDAHGTDHAPRLAGLRELRGRSVAWIRGVIYNGVPSGGMPAFHLPADELNVLAAMVYSLNSPAAEAAVPGDRAAGEKYFFGQGNCSSCHMVEGRGRAVGPDLSNVGFEMRVDEIRQSLLHPNAHTTPDYGLVTVRLRDGKMIRGFARSRSNFEIVVQDTKQKFHMLRGADILEIQQEKQSPMPPATASPKELENLIAYLSGLTGVKPGVSESINQEQPGGISWLRILHPQMGDWLSYNGRLNGNRYSKLTQIKTTNVNTLRLKWIFSVPLWEQFLPDTAYFRQNMKYFGLETTPLVADGVMYVTGPHEAFALDAGTGQKIWQYRRQRTASGVSGDASLGTNRGMAILGNKVFMTTDNAHLIALNRTTGKPVWEVVMPQGATHDGSTIAPFVVKDLVIAGVSGGDWAGVRGFIAAYKAANGELVWRRRIIPRKGDPGSETWGGNLEKAEGGATWLTGSYDPETDTLYWSTGNPYPDSKGRAPGDDLFTDSILALNPNTGKVKWFYQVTPHDVHDWDANAPLILVDANYQGRQRKLLLFTNKNGFFYVFDRTNGHVLLATPFVRLNWASGIGADGRPKLLPTNGSVCPKMGTNWSAKAFDPVTRFYYVMARESCFVKSAVSNRVQPARKYLRALNIDTGKVVWQVPQFGPAGGKRDAGVLATAGGVLFYGDPTGDIVAVNARSGKTIWHFATNGQNKASPMTYMDHGKQFLAVAVGPNILCFGLP
ncbi:MAG TPA: PQQ-binding-like beta-propeller repeat protein [Bryobacteraceae bacterium]